MHWFELPKDKRNEDAIRDYEREESRKIAGWLKRFPVIAFPLVLFIAIIVWFLNR